MDPPIVIVSGLPRSGTSMMMQMLRAGGLPVLADEHRAGDESNPHGYLEFEPVKRLAGDNSWVGMACGRAIKVIVQLLPSLPIGYSYRVIFMRRPVSDVVASQNIMLARRGVSPAADPKALEAMFERQLHLGIDWLRSRPNMALQTVDYQDCLANPHSVSQTIAEFLCPLKADPEKMATAVDVTLNRAGI